MVEIRLYEKEGSYTGSNETVYISTEIFKECDLFEKFVYDISYYDTYENWWNWWYKKSYLYVYIHPKKGENPIFTYYVDAYGQIIQKLEVYYSRLHKNVPLVIGIVRKDVTRYFTYSHLRKRNSYTGTPDEEFYQKDLKDRLVGENKTRNKLTFRVRDSSKNIKKDEEEYNHYRKHKYHANEDNFDGPYQFTMDNISHEKNFSNIEDTGLSSVNIRSFDFINVFHTDQCNLPLLLEFIDHSTFTESTKAYFKRICKNGTKWEKIDNKNGELDKQRQESIIEHLNFFFNKSIVIYINKNTIGDKYRIKLVENSYTTVLNHEELEMNINVNEQTNCLSDRKYKCYFHDLSKCQGHQVDSVTGLRLFITGQDNSSASDLEINLYDSDGLSQQYLYYNPSRNNVEKIDKIFLYFNDGDTVPLLLNYGKKWYAPKSKNEYFTKWLLVKDLDSLETPISSQPSTESKIISKLDKTNNDLNEVIINNQDNYGLNPTKSLKNFGSHRVNTTKSQNQFHRKIEHKCIKYVIGSLIYNGKELFFEESPVDLKEAYNRATVYYHLSDSEYELPLMIGFSKMRSVNPDVYYERTKKDKDTQWKRVQHSISHHFNNESSLTNKINGIHYNFNKSIVIQLEKQSEHNYDLCLVENGSSSNGPSKTSDGSRITVSECPSSIGLTKYKCYRHTINLGRETKPVLIGGLRLYISTKEIIIDSSNFGADSPIYYHDTKKEAYVYFYKSDKKAELTPLIVCYCNKYYGPTGLTQYFDKWKELSGVAEHQTEIQLDTITKELNTINISHTKHGIKYGITKPQSINELNQEFFDRISVTVCKNKYYYMITHSAINQFTIGNVNYNGKQIIPVDSQINSSKVCVYYDLSDNYFTKPLLICIGSQNLTDPSNNWYVRNNLEGSEWKNERDRNKYDSSSKLKKELSIIISNLFIFLTVKIESQEQYDTNITNNVKTHKVSIKIDRIVSIRTLKTKNYRCFDQELHKCYEDKDVILSSIGLSTSDLTLDISLELSGKKIALIDKSGAVVPILTYGNQESESRRSLYVYFYEPYDSYSDSTDVVPMMVSYKDRFFGPEAKNRYFDQWKEINISSSGPEIKDQIEAKLDDINSMLNEIDLSKTSDYGLFYCQKKRNSIGPSFKRIKVSIFKNKSYIMHIHETINKYKIGNIKTAYNQELKDHIKELSSQDIDEVVAIFEQNSIKHPKLILLNESGGSFGSTTYGYYYDKTAGGKDMKYTYSKIQDGCYLLNPLKEGIQDYDSPFYEGIDNIKPLLKEITSDPMKPEPVQKQSYIDESCIVQVDSESEMDKCSIMGSPDPTELSNVLPSPQGQQQEVTIQSNSLSQEPQIKGTYIHQVSTSDESLPEVLESHTDSVESSLGSLPGQEQSRAITHVGGHDQASLGQGSVEPGMSDAVTSLSPPDSGENGDRDQNLREHQDVAQVSRREEAVSLGTETELGQDGDTVKNEELPIVSGDSESRSDSVGGQYEHRDSNSEETTLRTGKRTVQETAVSEQDDNETSDDIGQKIKKIVKEHPEAVYGGGGTLATAAGGAYPVYKGIAYLMSK